MCGSHSWYSPPQCLHFWPWALCCFLRWSHTKPASAASTFPSCKSHHGVSKSDILTHLTPYRALNSSTYRSPFGAGVIMTEVYTEKKVLLCFVFTRVSLVFLSTCSSGTHLLAHRSSGVVGCRHFRGLPAVRELQHVCWDHLLVSRPFITVDVVEVRHGHYLYHS